MVKAATLGESCTGFIFPSLKELLYKHFIPVIIDSSGLEGMILSFDLLPIKGIKAWYLQKHAFLCFLMVTFLQALAGAPELEPEQNGQTLKCSKVALSA